MISIKDLTLREKICQTVIINKPDEIFEEYGGYKEFFKKYPVGGVYLGGAIVGGKMPGTEEYFSIQQGWNCEVKVPLIFCGDMEMLPDAPHNMALGATGDRELCYRAGVKMGKTHRCNGKHWIFGPVADICLSEVTPINIRAIGDDANKAKDMLERVVAGINSQKVVATAKHFPGMGRELADTHLTRVSVALTKEEWDATYRVIYQHLIDNGLMSVMSAHMSLPAYQTERDEYGFAPIATVSKELLTDLLKDDLGFKGVIVTDGLIMGGTSGNSAEFAVEALRAGNDMLLWPDMGYVDLLEEKIKNGEFPMERLDDAVERIFRMKEFVEVEKEITPERVPSEPIEQEIAERSITLLNNRENVIPVNREKIKKVLVVVAAMDKVAGERLDYLKEVFESYGIEVVVEHDLWIPKLREHEKEVDLTVFAIFEGPGTTPGPIMIHGTNCESIWASQAADKEKTIIASFGSPFLYNEYYRHIPTYINVYSPKKTSCEAFVKAIFGEIECKGKSPVKL